MLVVKVELWPFGSEERKRLLAEATIENAGEQEFEHIYRVHFTENGESQLQIPSFDRTVEIEGYDRRQSVWNLIQFAIEKVRGAATTGSS